MTDLLRDFQFLGITFEGWPQEFIGKYAGKKLILCAGASCVWDDIARLGISKATDKVHFMAINDVAMHLPMRVEHLYSNDYRVIPHWMGARRHPYVRKHGPIPFTHSCSPNHTHGIRWPWPGHGTSALNGTYSGLAMGYEPIILCGVPLDDTPNYFSPPWETRKFTKEVPEKVTGGMAYWSDAARKCFRGRVKSMSGRTRDLLGDP